MKPNHHLDFVRIKLITEKRLYSEEELTSSQKVVQFISKELAECDREVLCILNCNAKCQVINMNVVSMGWDPCITRSRKEHPGKKEKFCL